MEIIIIISIIVGALIVWAIVQRIKQKKKILIAYTWQEVIEDNKNTPGSQDFINIINKFFISDHLNPVKYLSNYKTLDDHMIDLSTQNIVYYLPTPSIFRFKDPGKRPFLPKWFIAGYPEITFWFMSTFDEKSILNIIPELKDNPGSISDKEGYPKQNILRRVIENYRIHVSSKFECM